MKIICSGLALAVSFSLGLAVGLRVLEDHEPVEVVAKTPIEEEYERPTEPESSFSPSPGVVSDECENGGNYIRTFALGDGRFVNRNPCTGHVAGRYGSFRSGAIIRRTEGFSLESEREPNGDLTVSARIPVVYPLDRSDVDQASYWQRGCEFGVFVDRTVGGSYWGNFDIPDCDADTYRVSATTLPAGRNGGFSFSMNPEPEFVIRMRLPSK